MVSVLVPQAGTALAPDPGLAWLEATIEAHRSTGADDWRLEVGRPAGELLATLWARSTPVERHERVVRFWSVVAALTDRGVALAAELFPEIAVAQAGG